VEWTLERLRLAKEAMRQALREKGLEQFRFLAPDEQEASDAVRAILVVLFPYYAGVSEGNLSMYCRGKDYHKVVPDYLESVEAAAQSVLGEALVCRSYADTGPFRDRYLVLRAGLGVVGRSQMMINDRLGTYFFVGYMTLNAPVEPDETVPFISGIGCLDCGRCVKACPGGAMREDGRFLPERCLSGITQKKGELEAFEKEILLKEHMIFGCDVCQTVCPMNQGVMVSRIPEFTEGRIDSLSMEDLEGLSRKGFERKYPDRAFTWRGPEVLRRNLRLLEEKRKQGRD